MKMKLTALSMAIAAAGLAATAAQAADVALFPYVVNSPTVTTLVSIVDTGSATDGYNQSGVANAGSRLHWRLNYKAGANATNNTASCEEVNYYLPSSTNDIQTVDLGGVFGSATKGVLFNDASTNNDWNSGTTSTINYMLGKAAGATQRGVLFVHNANTSSGQTLYGEAMVLDFSTGAAWGYQALLNDGSSNAAGNFDFSAQATNVSSAPDIVTFMPTGETTTRIFVTPVNSGGSMLDTNGANIPGWNTLNARVTLQTATGVAYDRDENLVSGSVPNNVVCVGAVDVTQMMTSGAAASLANGGWGNLAISAGTTTGATPTINAVATKLEFNTAGKLNGQAIPGTFNNGFIMR